MKWILLLCTALAACGQDHPKATPGEVKVDTTPALTQHSDASDMPTRNSSAEDNLIVPGERVGRIYLGMENGLMIKLLGAPDTGNAAMGKAWLTWKGERDEHNNATEWNVFTAYADSTMRSRSVQEIRTTSHQFHTSTGIRVYASLAELQKQFPHLKSVATYKSDHRQFMLYEDTAQGIAFEVVTAGEQKLCTGIIIYPKGGQVLAAYRGLQPGIQPLPR